MKGPCALEVGRAVRQLARKGLITPTGSILEPHTAGLGTPDIGRQTDTPRRPGQAIMGDNEMSSGGLGPRLPGRMGRPLARGSYHDARRSLSPAPRGGPFTRKSTPAGRKTAIIARAHDPLTV
jgi:hypothetical protein